MRDPEIVEDKEYEKYVINWIEINNDLKEADMEPSKIKSYDEWKELR